MLTINKDLLTGKNILNIYLILMMTFRLRTNKIEFTFLNVLTQN